MAEYIVEGTITRTELSLPDLPLTPENGYFVRRDGWGPGETSWRRQTVESVFVPGRILVHSVKDFQTSTLVVRVKGSTHDELESKMQELAEAVEQFTYTLTMLIDDQEYEYECECADYSLGENGNFQDLWLRSNMQMMSFSIPHAPANSGY